MSWAQEELSGADLGDRRRNKRLVKIVEDLAAQPNESVPQASRDNAAMQGTYEFWGNVTVHFPPLRKAVRKENFPLK